MKPGRWFGVGNSGCLDPAEAAAEAMGAALLGPVAVNASDDLALAGTQAATATRLARTSGGRGFHNQTFVALAFS